MGYNEHTFQEELVQIGHNYDLLSLNTEYHIHNFYEVYILIKGSVRYFVGSKLYDMTAGDMLLISDRDLHRALNVSGQAFERYTIHFDYNKVTAYCTEQTNLLDCFDRFTKLGRNMAKIPAHYIDDYHQLLREFKKADEREGYGRDALLISYLLRFLVATNDIYAENIHEPIRNDVVYPANILKIMKIIDDRIAEELTLDMIAEQMYMNKYHLSHYFKKHTGTTIYQYILLKRITLAKAALSQGKSVAEAGIQAGFRDYSNFIRIFKKIVGHSPGRYKKENTKS